MEFRAVRYTEKLNEDIKETMDKLEELSNKKWSKDYYDMLKEGAEKLDEIHECARKSPWEWSWGLDYFVEFLRFMRDYYKLGENVLAMERRDEDPKRYKNVPSRLESLEKTLYYYDKWQNLEKDYIKIVKHPETYRTRDNGDGTVTIQDMGFHCEYKYGPRNNKRKAMKITYKKLNKDQAKYKKKFYKMLMKYLEDWWD